MKKPIPPITVFTSLLTFTMFSTLYAGAALNFDNSNFSIWGTLLLAISVLSMILQVILLIIAIKNKKKIEADEYTQSILHRAGYFTYIIVAFLISIFFVSSSLVLNLNSNTSNISDLLDVKLILSLIVLIQLIGTTLFSFLYFIFNKKGNY